MTNSRQKGARGERELAEFIRGYGFPARRGQQYSGANGDADVVGVPGFHIECKRTNTIRLRDWLSQARRDAKPGEIPIIFWREDGGKWIAIIDGDNEMEMIAALNGFIGGNDGEGR